MNPSLNESNLKSKPFEFQNWPVYRQAVSFSKTAKELCGTLPKEGRNGLADQLTRASHSVSLNIAEGCARTTSKDKANFLRIAKGSLFECVAIMDLMGELEFISTEKIEKIQMQLAEIGKMLSGLIRYLEKEGPPERLRR